MREPRAVAERCRITFSTAAIPTIAAGCVCAPFGCRGGADPGASAAFTIGGKAGGACESDVRDARSPSCTDQRTLEEDAEADEEVEYRVPSEVAPADNGDATDGGRTDGWVRRGCINSGGGAGIDG